MDAAGAIRGHNGRRWHSFLTDPKFGKKRQCRLGSRPDAIIYAGSFREKQEHLPAFVVFALDDVMTGDESLG
jgi:hypothetical protein